MFNYVRFFLFFLSFFFSFFLFFSFFVLFFSFSFFPAQPIKTGKPNNSPEPANDFKASAVLPYARTETSAVSKHAHTGHQPFWSEVKFIDREPDYHTRRVKDVIHIRLYPDIINRNSGIEIPEACMPMIKKTQQLESRATADRQGSKSLIETARIDNGRIYNPRLWP